MNDSTSSPRPAPWSAIRPGLVWLALLLLALALRVYRLPVQSVWYDEGVSWYLTRTSLPALTLWTAQDIQPPLYYYLLWFWVRLVGTSEYALRFPSVYFGTLSVPLLWVAARRLWGQRAAWLAAVWLTVSPLHVYYAQEARMYTWLAFLGLLSSYLLVRLHCIPAANLRSPYAWAFVLSTVAALYTHYFAFFLLAAHALYSLYRWWAVSFSQPGSSRPVTWKLPISLPISISISILILYLPWLPFLVTRYGVDTSYWPGALKLGEVARKLFVAFSLGETVTEPVGIWLSAGYALIFLFSLVVLLTSVPYAIRNTQDVVRTVHCVLRKDSLIFLLLYLLVPIALVLLVVWRTPKFNPRYAMLASPAFILLLTGGLARLADRRPTADDRRPSHLMPHVSRFTFYVLRFIFAISLLFILATSVYSLGNWFALYAANQFNKADFRITSHIVGERIGPNETVLLSSGHMFPAWAYYYGWQGWHRLPDLEVLDVNAALDLSVGEELDRLLPGKQGVWLVRWQNEVTDPFDVLPLYLGVVGTQDDYGQFWHMELFHYRLPADARFDLESFVARPVGADFGQVRLLGLRQTSDGELVLVWEAVSAMQADYTIFVHLLDARGTTLANGDHLPARPTREWRPGHIVPDQVRLPLPAGLPAGDYRIEIGLYDAHDPDLSPVPLTDGSGDRVTVPLHIDVEARSVEAKDLE